MVKGETRTYKQKRDTDTGSVLFGYKRWLLKKHFQNSIWLDCYLCCLLARQHHQTEEEIFENNIIKNNPTFTKGFRQPNTQLIYSAVGKEKKRRKCCGHISHLFFLSSSRGMWFTHKKIKNKKGGGGIFNVKEMRAFQVRREEGLLDLVASLHKSLATGHWPPTGSYTNHTAMMDDASSRDLL